MKATMSNQEQICEVGGGRGATVGLRPPPAHLGADGLGRSGAERSSVMVLLSLMLLIWDSRPTPLWLWGSGLPLEGEGAWG